MQEFKIHSEGQNDHLIFIKAKYSKLKNSLKQNIKLTRDEKQTEQKRIEDQLNKEQKDIKQNLY